MSHGHSHDHEAVNIKAAVIHIAGDLVQSIGVLVAGIIIKCLGSGILKKTKHSEERK